MNRITWTNKVSIFKNNLILKQLGIAMGIHFGILLTIMLIAGAYYGVLLVSATLLLTFIVVLIVFKGTYDVSYQIDSKGILCENQPMQAKKVKRRSALAVILGLCTRNYSAAGAGMLAGARTKQLISWKNIRKTKYNDPQKTILIKGGFGENIALFCTDDNYEIVKELIHSQNKSLVKQ